MNKSCATCVHSLYDWSAEDYVCQNANSMHFAEWYSDGCMQWKGYEDGQNRCDQMVEEDKNTPDWWTD